MSGHIVQITAKRMASILYLLEFFTTAFDLIRLTRLRVFKLGTMYLVESGAERRRRRGRGRGGGEAGGARTGGRSSASHAAERGRRGQRDGALDDPVVVAPRASVCGCRHPFLSLARRSCHCFRKVRRSAFHFCRRFQFNCRRGCCDAFCICESHISLVIILYRVHSMKMMPSLTCHLRLPVDIKYVHL